MYTNIGGKIKALAIAVFVVGLFGSVLLGVGLMVTDENALPVGITMLLVGPVMAFFSSWLVYGFGELIDQASAIERNTRVGAQGQGTVKAGVLEQNNDSSDVQYCAACGSVHTKGTLFCGQCGQRM
ncbi:MAG: hypothetical protein IJN76_03015 [Clostridia bacterium]|nr:hypothetical protein [Clostridia bacterium]